MLYALGKTQLKAFPFTQRGREREEKERKSGRRKRKGKWATSEEGRGRGATERDRKQEKEKDRSSLEKLEVRGGEKEPRGIRVDRTITDVPLTD